MSCPHCHGDGFVREEIRDEHGETAAYVDHICLWCDAGKEWKEWQRELARRLAPLIMANPELTPVDRFDRLTALGYKLDLVKNFYYWPEPEDELRSLK